MNTSRMASLLLVILVAACSGGTNPTQAGGDSTPTATAGNGGSGGGQPTAEPTVGGGGGGTTGAGACDLVTAGEMDGAVGVTGLTTNLVPGPPDTCGYSLEGVPVAALVLTTEAGELVFSAMQGDSTAVAISGVGDKAIYVESAQTFLVLKGGRLLTIAISSPDEQLPGTRMDVMKAVATIAAGRL